MTVCEFYVEVTSASSLLAADANGFSDPFVEIYLAHEDPKLRKKNKLKTKTILKSLNPVWGEEFRFEVPHMDPEDIQLKFKIYDWDKIGKNDYLGYVDFGIKDKTLYQNEYNSFTLDVKEGQGTLTIRVMPISFGALRNPMFGVSLREILSRDTDTHVPSVVRFCAGILYKRSLTECFKSERHKGIAAEGIFRVSGNDGVVKNLRYRFDNGLIKNEQDLEDLSDHDIAALLKQFLRELDQPLLTFEAYKPLMRAVSSGKSDDDLVCMIKKIITSKLTPHEEVLVNVVLFLLNQASKLEDTNLMGVKNLAIIFSQTILYEPIAMCGEEDDLHSAVKEVSGRARVCEIMIEKYSTLFTGRECSLVEMYGLDKTPLDDSEEKWF
ncbi:Rho GTPase-activating protein ArhGAP [Acrasis kona]|uniref:Rho GTPase-activating protein ArhGAP n=1 Tax=Acrasis kona TaxID=1008807 RepID=A0AAW2Z4F3_9EUKA